MRTRLIQMRQKQGLSQSQVANKLGITRSFYGMIETGDRNPTLGLAKKIAEFFQVNIEDIFFDDLGNEALRDVADPPTGTEGR